MTTDNVQGESLETQGTPAPEAGNIETAADEDQDDAQPDTEQDAADEGAQKPTEDAKKEYSERVSKRIGELTGQLREQERRNAALEQRLAEVEKRSAPPPAERPKKEDFDTEEAYEDALLDWRDERRKAEESVKEQKASQTSQRNQDIQKLQQSFEQKEAAFKAKNPDYDDVWPDFIIPPSETGKAVGQFIAAHEMGPDLIYKLGKDIDLAGSLFAMPPEYAVRKLESIAGSLKAPPQTQTKLPDPPSSLKGTPATGKSLDRMSGDEILAAVRKR